MGVRFRKRVKIAPGVYLNFSGSGVSASVGVPGASVSFGKRGVHRNLGIPGTGLYSRQKISGSSSRSTPPRSANRVDVPVNVGIDDDGTILFQDGEGQPLDEYVAREAKKQKAEEIRGMMQGYADEINGAIQAIVDIHHQTPSQQRPFPVNPRSFDKPKPQRPTLERLSPITAFFRPKRRREVAENNVRKQAAYDQAIQAWNKLRKSFDAKEKQQIELLQSRLGQDVDTMEQFFSEQIAKISWPRETDVSLEISSNGTLMNLDVDLPEIEDLPTQSASAPQRGWKVSIKAISEKQRRLNYARHIHGIVFRLTGEVFSLLPAIDRVIVSGYSQRPSSKTGHIEDDYLISVCISRTEWGQVDFRNLEAVDPVEALTLFDLRRNMTKTGIFKPVTPIS